MTKKAKMLSNVLAAVLVVAGIGVAWFFLSANDYEVTNDAQIEQYMSPVNAKATGYIKEIRFSEHQRVKKGDTLVIIDDREYRIALMQAEAQLKEAQNAMGVVGNTEQTAQNSASAIESQIEEARIRVRKLTVDYERFLSLLERKATTPMVVEQYKTDLDMAKARVAALESQLRAARSQTSEVATRRGSVDANIMKAEAAVEMARLNLSYTVISAPVDGVLGRRTIEEGQLVTPGMSITTILSGRTKWVVANFKETQVASLHEGQEVSILVDAFEGKEFHGKITTISSATGSKYSMIPTDNASGNFVKIQQRIPVRIDFTDADSADVERMAAGMMAEVKVKK